MNPEETITLKFRNATFIWRKDTLAQIPYFATLFKSEWSKNKTEFTMEEDSNIFVSMVKKYKKNARLCDLNKMADYYGIDPDDLLSLKDDRHLLLDGYKEFSRKIEIVNDKYSLVDLTDTGKILSIKHSSGSFSNSNKVLIKLDIDSDEFIRVDEKTFSSYVLKEINKTKKFWVTVVILKDRIYHESCLFIDVKSCN